MTIAVGEQIPKVNFTTMTEEGPQPVTPSELFAGKKVALFSVPGAFTPTCSLKLSICSRALTVFKYFKDLDLFINLLKNRLK